MTVITIQWTAVGLPRRDTEESLDVDDLLTRALIVAGWRLTGETLSGFRVCRPR